jgi:hypothetical protein
MNETLTFDAGWLARAWLAVAEASSKDKGRPALDRTVCVEFHPDGVRLVATDSYMLLTAWVPRWSLTNQGEPVMATAPELDEAPDHTVVAIDSDGRAKGLFTYLLALVNGKDAPEVRVTLTTGPTPIDLGPALIFDGTGAECLTIAAEDREALLLGLYEGGYPTWRPVVGRFHGAMTPVLSLNPDILGRVVKMAKVGGADHIDWRFGGTIGPAKVEVIGTPTVTGLVMPVRWTGTA